MTDFAAVDEAWSRYSEEQERYERAAKAVAFLVEETAKRQGIRCDIHARAKTPAEFLKKAIRKGGDYLVDPWNKMTDKAGARATVFLLEDVDNLASAIEAENLLEVVGRTDSRDSDPKLLNYRGLHLQVLAPAEEGDAEQVQCELQLRTQAQDLWAPLSHRFLYKPAVDLPHDVQRSLYRLVSLVEMFDEEVQRAVHVIRQLPGYEVSQLLDIAERNFLTLVPHAEFDRSLSMQVLSALAPTILPHEDAVYPEILDRFVNAKVDDIRALLEEYGPRSGASARYALLSQPEIVVFLERLDHAPIALGNAWREADLPESLLGATSAVWGVSL